MSEQTNPQINDQARPITPEQALSYVSELVGEYLKTLPAPVRQPVLQTVNACLAVIDRTLKAHATVDKQIDKASKAAKAKAKK